MKTLISALKPVALLQRIRATVYTYFYACLYACSVMSMLCAGASVQAQEMEIILDSPVDGSWHNGSFLLQGRVTAAADITLVKVTQKLPSANLRVLTVCGGGKEPCDSGKQYILNRIFSKADPYLGDIEFTVLVQDASGNEATLGRRTIRYDGDAPKIGEVHAKWSDGGLGFNGSVSDKGAGLGPGGDGKDALTIRWRRGADAAWSAPILADASSSGVGAPATFAFTLDKALLGDGDKAEVEITVRDRVDNAATQTSTHDLPRGALKLVKRVDKPSAQSGDTLEYTIEFTNISNDYIELQAIRDALDQYVRLVTLDCGSDFPASIDCEIEPGEPSERTATWRFKGRLGANESGTVRYRVRID